MQKHSKKDLEKFRSIFFLAGLVIAMAAALTTFSLKVERSHWVMEEEATPLESKTKIDQTSLIHEQISGGDSVQVASFKQPVDTDRALEYWTLDELPTPRGWSDEKEATLIDLDAYISDFVQARLGKDLLEQRTHRIFIDLEISNAGAVRNIKVHRSPTAQMEMEVTRILERVPTLAPGSKDGVPQAVKLIIPVKVGKDV
ncbi:MAG: hypothetical protein HWD92_10690 [Flavobacteriia bacterium]|nr:hypothetical protein [Flavobacteriia bacterium]